LAARTFSSAVNGVAIGSSAAAADVDGITLGFEFPLQRGREHGDRQEHSHNRDAIDRDRRRNAYTTGQGSTAVGYGSSADFSSSTAIGADAYAPADSSTALGQNAAGDRTSVSTAIGAGATATGANEIRLGRANDTTKAAWIQNGYGLVQPYKVWVAVCDLEGNSYNICKTPSARTSGSPGTAGEYLSAE